MLRGDHELNALKAERHPAVSTPLEFASDGQIRKALGCPAGSLGPVGLELPVLVDAAAAQGVDLPYSCKGGVCATCRTHLRSGKVDMAVNYGLDKVRFITPVPAGGRIRARRTVAERPANPVNSGCEKTQELSLRCD